MHGHSTRFIYQGHFYGPSLPRTFWDQFPVDILEVFQHPAIIPELDPYLSALPSTFTAVESQTVMEPLAFRPLAVLPEPIISSPFVAPDAPDLGPPIPDILEIFQHPAVIPEPDPYLSALPGFFTGVRPPDILETYRHPSIVPEPDPYLSALPSTFWTPELPAILEVYRFPEIIPEPEAKLPDISPQVWTPYVVDVLELFEHPAVIPEPDPYLSALPSTFTGVRPPDVLDTFEHPPVLPELDPYLSALPPTFWDQKETPILDVFEYVAIIPEPAPYLSALPTTFTGVDSLTVFDPLIFRFPDIAPERDAYVPFIPPPALEYGHRLPDILEVFEYPAILPEPDAYLPALPTTFTTASDTTLDPLAFEHGPILPDLEYYTDVGERVWTPELPGVLDTYEHPAVIPEPEPYLSALPNTFATSNDATLEPLSFAFPEIAPELEGAAPFVAPSVVGSFHIPDVLDVYEFPVPLPDLDAYIKPLPPTFTEVESQTVMDPLAYRPPGIIPELDPASIAPPVVWSFAGVILKAQVPTYGVPAQWAYEACMRATAGTVHSRLYNLTSSVEVSGSQVTTTSGTLARHRSGAITLVHDAEYRAQVGVESGAAGAIIGAHAVRI